MGDLLFGVEFENGSLVDQIDGFSYFMNYGQGIIELSEAAAMVGSYGCAITPVSGYYLAGVKTPGYRTSRIRQSFRFNPNGIIFNIGSSIYIANNFCNEEPGYYIYYYNSSGVYVIGARIYKDDNSYLSISPVLCTDSPHTVELDWKRSFGADDGFLSLWLDGNLVGTVSGVDNDTKRIGYPALGCCSAAPAGVVGSIYFDHWRANDTGAFIG